ncbi:hypothetical protein IC229_22760 [Spirosoma sp. BT702]|uniref:Lipoprotein n=1 Tax=Spirosoma profusum TaxID=2771354 RepID=A0A927AP80_9BACT|nr:hypothetical protein [Spirosoma profusum]MBD2703484.1 hypothetical protein [Spirosoma profusum]
MKKLNFLLLLVVCACQEQGPNCEETTNQRTTDQTAGLVVSMLDDRYLAYDTKQGEDLGRFGIKITDAQQYRRVFSYCCENRLDSVDFAQFDVLGLTTVNLGSNSTYLLDVKRDDAAKKIVYTVTERYCQKASPFDGRGNFVVVPKLPTAYQVEYVRNQ